MTYGLFVPPSAILFSLVFFIVCTGTLSYFTLPSDNTKSSSDVCFVEYFEIPACGLIRGRGEQGLVLKSSVWNFVCSDCLSCLCATAKPVHRSI